MLDLSIKPIKTTKDKIEQPQLAKLGIIPKLGSSIIFCGSSGSGKSTLLANLLLDDRFYGKYKFFKHIFLFSPTAGVDDIQKSLKLPEPCIFTDLDTAPAAIEKIYNHQMKEIAEKGIDKVGQICIVYDDCIGNSKFMKNTWVIKSFIASRHFACTTMICAQHFHKIEKVNRLQASQLYFWPMSRASLQVLSDEFTPAGMSTHTFENMIESNLESAKYNFIGINMKCDMKDRFRLNLGHIINLDFYKNKT
jgi:hypothetical protein